MNVMTMKKLFSIAYLFLLLSALPSMTLAQERIERRTTLTEDLQARQRVEGLYPLLFREVPLLSRQGELTVPFRSSHQRERRNASSGRMLWANVNYSATWDGEMKTGLYAMNTVPPITFSPLAIDNDYIGLRGNGIQDGRWYFMTADLSTISAGYIDAFLIGVDVATWERVSRVAVTNYSLLAICTTQEQLSGKIYGEFYNQELSGAEWGIIDYKTQTRTTIGPASIPCCALGATNDGRLYGIGLDGGLYQIDTSTGAETLIGNTGIEVSDENYRYYGQSGTIDPLDNTFYWASLDKSGESAFYTVDLATGEVMLVDDYGGYQTQLYALTVPPLLTAFDAPNVATDLSVEFPNGSLNGTLSFTAPSTTYGDQPLEGELDYTIVSNNTTLFKGKVMAGGKTTVDVTAFDGDNTFVVTTSNSAGDSPKCSLQAWVGYDIPMPATDVVLSVDGLTGIVSLTWSTPSIGVHNGWLGELSYDVYCNKGGVFSCVATGLSDTHFTETLTTEQYTSLIYAVVVKNAGRESQRALSNSAFIGDALEVPYFEDFLTQDAFNLFAVVDANEDGKTWRWNKSNTSARSDFNKTLDADDWLFTPAIRMEAGRTYRLAFTAHNAMTGYPEEMEVCMGTSVVPSQQTTVLLERFTVADKQPQHLMTSFQVSNDGDYHLGFHDISPANRYMISLDSISIVALATDEAPDSVTCLRLTADEKGLTKATVAFRTPTTTVGGMPLSSLSKVVVLRGEEEIHEFTQQEPGIDISFVDEQAVQGYNTYTVIPYNEQGYGRENTQTVFVGQDMPTAPVGEITDIGDRIVVSWSPVAGEHGGIVRPEDTRYAIYEMTAEGDVGNLKAAGILGTSYSIERDPSKGDQQVLRFALKASCPGGESDYGYTLPHVVGQSKMLPFEETFADCVTHEMIWQEGRGFSMTNTLSAPADGYAMAFVATVANDFASLNTGKICLAGSTNPVLVFNHLSTPERPTRLSVVAVKADGQEQVLHVIDYSGITERRWQREQVSLKELQKERFIVLKFHVEAGGAGTMTAIDQIVVSDLKEYNLAANVSAPSQLYKGQDAQVSVEVLNKGTQEARGFSVRLISDGCEVAEQSCTEGIAPLQSREFTFSVPTYAIDTERQRIKLQAVVDYLYDLDERDNTATATIALSTSDLPTLTSLHASTQGNGAVTLHWTIDAAGVEEQTETFEDFEAWENSDLGEWGAIDYNGKHTYAFDGVNYPYRYNPQAWMVFNPSELGIDLEQNINMNPYSGNQYLVSFNVSPAEQGAIPDQTDHWLVSPQLSGEPQTISFHAAASTTAYGNEKIQFLYSTSGTKKNNFHLLKDITVSNTPTGAGEWGKTIEVDVPRNTQYFAIRHCSTDAMALFLDDISYRTGTPAPVAYRVYRDGVWMATVASEEMRQYTDNTEAETHDYAVSAVYADGIESLPTHVLVDASTATGIGVVDGESVVEGQAVYDLTGRKSSSTGRGVIIIGSKKRLKR